MKQAHPYLRVAVQQARVLCLVRWLLQNLALGAPLGAALWLADWVTHREALLASLGAALVFLVIQIGKERAAWPSIPRFIDHLNRTHSVFEESADLLMEDAGQLAPLQRIQRDKIQLQLEAAPSWRWLPRAGWIQAQRTAAWGFGAALLFGALKLGMPQGVTLDPRSFWASSQPGTFVAEEVELSWSLTLKPPAYTQLDTQVQNHPHVSVVQGTHLHWNLNFDRQVADLKVHFRPGETILLEDGTRFDWQQVVQQPGYYYLEFQVAGKAQRTAYFPLEVRADEPPVIDFLQPEETRTEIPENSRTAFDLALEASDDYGVAGGELVITVAKGNGENVKFRERRAALQGWEQGEKTKRVLTAQLIFQDWEAMPGDEVYLHAEIWDNRTPEPNRARSDTYFLVLLGGDRPPKLDTEGILIKPVRAYFRSQRQIIIDTEKLLAQRAEISPQAFRERSETLGVDQKVLRLRYGQFLGEEFESEIGISFTPPESDAHHHAHDGHDHAGEGLPEGLPSHDHGEEEGFVRETLVTENVQDLLPEGLLHDHDNAETATFFEPELKAQLKDALSEMWSSELHLRSVDPEASLPYQYRALKMIKDIQQMSRVYEQRAGIEMPPLEPEKKRLTGERKNMAGLVTNHRLQTSASSANLRLLWNRLEKGSLTIADKDLLDSVLPVFEEATRQNPGTYLPALEALHQLRQHPESCPSCGETVQAVLWQLLPEETPLPDARETPRSGLGQTFLQHLGQKP